MLFPHSTAADGWHVNLKLHAEWEKLTTLVYYSHHIVVRQNMSILFRAKQLFQQFLVDAYWKIEAEWLKILMH